MTVNVFLLLASLAFAQPQPCGEVTECITLAPGTKVSVENLLGSVKVSFWDRPEMRIGATRRGKCDVTLQNQEGDFLLRSVFPGSRYRVPPQVAPGLLIEGHPWAMSFAGRTYYFQSDAKAQPPDVDYDLAVPADINLDIEVGIGSVEVDLGQVNPRSSVRIVVRAGNIEAITSPEGKPPNARLVSLSGKVKYTKKSLAEDKK